MVDLLISASFLQKAQTYIDFMQDHDVNYMATPNAFSYSLMARVEELDKDKLADKSVVIGNDGKEYVEFDPEYRLDGCIAKIFKHGEIRAVIPFRDSAGELWFTVGNIKELTAMLHTQTDQNNATRAFESPRG